MKKKNLALVGLATLAGFSLASCNKKVDAGRLDISVNYNGKQGITLRDASYANPIENRTYVKGDLLPTWTAFAEATNATIFDASDYASSKDNDDYTAVDTRGYTSATDNAQMIDLYYNSTANIEKMGAADKAENLLDYLDVMPNFKKWLDENPTMRAQITKNAGTENEAIYYTPYFDGYQETERMFIMNTEIVVKVLDGTPKYDDELRNGGTNPAANLLQKGSYTPFVNADYNYAADQTLTIASADGTKTQKITVKKTTNIIKQQNELLNRAEGCTGKELADQFVAYLKTAYQTPNSGVFSNLSDIFVGQQAAYNADDLIALMRVVKANPGLITADKNAEVECLVPRAAANNRVDNMADFMAIWGVSGLDAEKDALYFGPDGKMHDAYTSKSTFDALKYLSQIYDEGLIIENFYYKTPTVGTSSTGYLDKYFGGKKVDNKAYGLIMYDYSASTGASNDRVDGIGSVNAVSVKGVRPIIPPFTYWATSNNWKGADQDLTDFTGKTLTRHSDSNRALKNNSWCIPASSDNKQGAAVLMDYIFSEDGNRIQNFGPSQYWEAELGTVLGETSPIFSKATKAMIASQDDDFWTFMRAKIGATHGIGHIRTASVNQQATNTYAQTGYTYLQTAIKLGVCTQGLFDKYEAGKYSYDSTVPAAGYASFTKEQTNKYEALNLFWSSDKCAETANGWVKYVVTPYNDITDSLVCGTLKDSGTSDYTFGDAFGQRAAKNTEYLYNMISSNKLLGANYIPSYAKPKA